KGFSISKQASLELTDSDFASGDPSSGTPQSLNLTFAAGSTLAQIAAQINAQAGTFDSNKSLVGSFASSSNGTLTIKSQPFSLGSITINQGDTLQTIAANINGNTTLAAAGVQATVASDGVNEWLRLYDQQGKALQMAESLTSGAPQELNFSTA